MAIEIDYDNIPDTKVKIYAETANYILTECYNSAASIKNNTKEKGKFDKINGDPYILQAVLNSLIKKQPITARFIQAKHRETAGIIEKGLRYKTVGFDHHYILTLAIFAGVNDYVKLDRSYGPLIAMPVLFVYKPFSIFKLIRIPLQGLLSETTDNWRLTADNGAKLSGDVTNINLYTMPGDRQALWLEITYYNNNKQHTLYLAQEDNQQIQPAARSGLKAFFDRLIPVS